MQNNTTKNQKKIKIVRHAKSSWKYSLQDISRPIKPRGTKDCMLITKYLLEKKLNPDLILCSPAKRTRETAKIFIDQLKLENIPFKITPQLYDFSGEDLIATVKNTDDSINDLLIFGHNYALTNFVNKFGNTFIENVVTSGYVEIVFNEDSWRNINKGITKRIVFPKDLKVSR